VSVCLHGMNNLHACMHMSNAVLQEPSCVWCQARLLCRCLLTCDKLCCSAGLLHGCLTPLGPPFEFLRPTAAATAAAAVAVLLQGTP
jgi:hypothetical protein